MSPCTRGLGELPLRTAASSPVTSDEVAGRGADPAPGAFRLLAVSNESPELARSWLCACRRVEWMTNWRLLTNSGHGAESGHHWLLLSSWCQCQPQLLEEGGGEFECRYSLNEGQIVMPQHDAWTGDPLAR